MIPTKSAATKLADWHAIRAYLGKTVLLIESERSRIKGDRPATLLDIRIDLSDTNDPDYNYTIRSSPEHEPASESMHWYLAIVPRVNRVAGFEMGSGMFINTALPEESAAFLRSVAPRTED